MADINQIITLGIGTPSGITNFLLLGLSVGEEDEVEVAAPTKGRRPQRIPFSIAPGPRIDLLTIEPRIDAEIRGRSATAYRSRGGLTVESPISGRVLLAPRVRAHPISEITITGASSNRASARPYIGALNTVGERLQRLQAAQQNAEEEWLLGLR